MTGRSDRTPPLAQTNSVCVHMHSWACVRVCVLLTPHIYNNTNNNTNNGWNASCSRWVGGGGLWLAGGQLTGQRGEIRSDGCAFVTCECVALPCWALWAPYGINHTMPGRMEYVNKLRRRSNHRRPLLQQQQQHAIYRLITVCPEPGRDVRICFTCISLAFVPIVCCCPAVEAGGEK